MLDSYIRIRHAVYHNFYVNWIVAFGALNLPELIELFFFHENTINNIQTTIILFIQKKRISINHHKCSKRI
ncbi:MAG: hypothetical protein AUK23_01640 [Deltaproteobacteria bacterium CG2_30_43_15]|nr:MAG: hypothetical protein AUK23_01640 [Deltaproteobacteria bacterium CG2_30_43_15]